MVMQEEAKQLLCKGGCNVVYEMGIGSLREGSGCNEFERVFSELAVPPPSYTNILHSGVAEVVGILGPSGSGKTLLLNLLTFNSSGSSRQRLWGSMTLDKAPIESVSHFMAHCSFVPNEVLNFPTLKCRDVFWYAAKAVSPENVDARVDSLIAMLGLEGCAGTVVGGYLGIRGLSGGQLKRLSIGLALLKPTTRVLFLDEPTSGRNSSTSRPAVPQRADQR